MTLAFQKAICLGGLRLLDSTRKLVLIFYEYIQQCRAKSVGHFAVPSAIGPKKHEFYLKLLYPISRIVVSFVFIIESICKFRKHIKLKLVQTQNFITKQIFVPF